MKPPFRWAKRSPHAVRDISCILTPPAPNRVYWEPFCGAATNFFLWHHRLGRRVVLSDAHQGVITVLKAIRDDPVLVSRARKGLPSTSEFAKIAEWLRLTEAPADLYQYFRVLQAVSIFHQSYDAIRPQAGDLVYCDPPVWYGQAHEGPCVPFDGVAHAALARRVREWAEAGVVVGVSLADTLEMRVLYQGLKVQKLRGEILVVT